jgi:predicted amidohydrolase
LFLMKVKVAVLQYDVPYDTDDSFKKLSEMVLQASWAGAKLVVAPETAVGNYNEIKERSVDYFSPLAEIAANNSVYLATSYYINDKGKFFDQGQIIAPDGKSVLSHRKIYLAKSEIEDKIENSNTLGVERSEIGNLSMLICKDGFNKYSHFLYDKLGQLAADIICIPSWSLGWKEMNIQEYIKALFVYGAFASRAFVLVAGNLNKSTNSFGRSLIISPVRGVLKEGSVDRKEIIYEDLDLGEVKKAREFDSWWQPKKKVETK